MQHIEVNDDVEARVGGKDTLVKQLTIIPEEGEMAEVIVETLFPQPWLKNERYPIVLRSGGIIISFTSNGPARITETNTDGIFTLSMSAYRHFDNTQFTLRRTNEG